MHSDPQLPECVFPPPLFKPVSSQQAPQVSRRQDGGQPLGRQGWRSRQLLSPSQGHSHATHNTHTRAKTREDRLTRPGVCGNPLLQSGAGVAHSQCPGTSLQQHLLENLEQDDLIGLYPRGFSHRRSNTPHADSLRPQPRSEDTRFREVSDWKLKWLHPTSPDASSSGTSGDLCRLTRAVS
ncbi:uncharacterized protein [Macaca nemestrina]|uniref:uncharacterized protein isoform X2 n=1 Tax=Macaca nemestrina TaxID=9545 RepID=UPI0039B8B80E